ncbi:MAG: hypothetical protein LUG18_14010 [Candidatus Azobacteroides sp.]|nr:hypothetical protein [Candidatus Azobacteroides sp.]
MKTVLAVLCNFMLYYILEGVGKFFPTLKGLSVKQKRKSAYPLLYLDAVHFHPVSRLKNRLRRETFLSVSACIQFKKSSSLSTEERKARVAPYLSGN